MVFEYSFENPTINLLLVLILWIYFLLGIRIFTRITYKTYESEYRKDPKFEEVPRSLRWKILVLVLVSPFLLGVPMIGGGLSIGGSIFYLLSPVIAPDLIHIWQYVITVIVVLLYFKFLATRFHTFLYQFIRKEFEFEIFFRKNTKNWGLMNSGDEIFVSDVEYRLLALWGKAMIHAGLVPITIIAILQIF